MENNDIIKARTCTYSINYHIVWSVKNCNPVLKNGVDCYLKELFYCIAEEKDFIVYNVDILQDNVNLFVSAHPKISPSYMVKMLKGISARKLFIEYPDLQKQLDNKSLWNNSYYIETIGSTSEKNIKQYLYSQREK